MAFVPELGLDPLLYDFLQKLILALMIGVLIGIEREHRRSEQQVFAGVRTFAITCIAGMFATFVADVVGYEILLITTIMMAAFCIVLVYRIYSARGKLGMTSSIALFCTYLLGILVARDYYLFAIIGGVILTFLLIEKKPLHSFAETLSDDEILNALQFLAVVFILYPLMPPEPVLGIVDLRSMILIVVLVLSISFVSYLSLKGLGTEGGISYSGLFGGFVSSEATTGALSVLSKNRSGLVDAIYVGILLSNVSMFISNLVIALIVDTSGQTLMYMLPPQIMMLILALVIVKIRKREFDIMSEPLEIGSPFALRPAFKFGFMFAVLQVIATTANEVAGPIGTYAIALGGLVSSSAVTASVAALASNGSISYSVAAQTAVIAGIISTLNKLMLIRVSGSSALLQRSRNTMVLLALVGAAGLVMWSYYVWVLGL